MAHYHLGDAPVNLAAAAYASGFVSLKMFNHIEIIFIKAVGASGEPPTLTILQALNVSGGTPKALNFTKYTRKTGADVTAVGLPTVTTKSSGNTLALAAGNTEELIVIEFDASELDVANGYDCVGVTIADVGDTAQWGTVLFRLSEPRYDAALSNPIVN